MLAFRQARIEAERRRQKALEKETEAWEEEKRLLRIQEEARWNAHPGLSVEVLVMHAAGV
jgi:hypothetical protein